MKNLIMREFYLGRKTIRICFITILVFMLIGNLVLLSARCGNIAKYVSTENLDMIFPYVRLGLAFMVFFACMDVSGIIRVIFSDYSAGFNKYLNTTPLKMVKYIGAKYISMFILFLCGILLGFINLFISNAVSHTTLSKGDIAVIAFLCGIFLIAELLAAFLFIRFRKSSVISFIGMVMMILLMLLFFVFIVKSGVGDALGEGDYKGIYDIVTGFALKYIWIMIILVIVTAFASFYGSCKAAKSYGTKV